MHPAEVEKACHLIDEVFERYNAPDYSVEGTAEFRKYNHPDAVRARTANHFAWVAVDQGHLVGVIEIRNHRHISQLFVASEWKGKGIARKLWSEALQQCLQVNPDLKEFTVYSSPYAVVVYEKLGFRQSSPEQSVNGLRFIPMVLHLKASE
jgi:GNAT superfamily N-acetyltransferase